MWLWRGKVEGQGQLGPQHAAAEEAVGFHAGLHLTHTSGRPEEHAVLGAQPQHDHARRAHPPGSRAVIISTPNTEGVRRKMAYLLLACPHSNNLLPFQSPCAYHTSCGAHMQQGQPVYTAGFGCLKLFERVAKPTLIA